ncbi:hypothetical protein GCM10011613_06480 [Cellvibrio zantedeschiae]|uniref:Periplasmic heavy metal sensor n=1 Tax=Cellvibrio zantedeschiae TaxID=1237077 RepID=A0ABQ3AT88_9GAMM|nr:Spy/CpxP family protein refolding chaperone [Cellvibrio zantedeschiae]GGY65327.1 hypothetical protein GCM10011613_06480 [Cellvibrio zantedeschiae]
MQKLIMQKSVMKHLNMKKLSMLMAAIVATSIFSFPAVAQTDVVKKCEPSEHHERFADEKGDAEPWVSRHKFKHHFPAAKLDLTDEQKKVLEDARNAQEPAQRELHDKLRTAHEALIKAGETNADDVTLARLAKDFSELLAQQELARINMHKQFVSVLTPEQKQKLDSFKAERKNSPHKREFRKQE